ncbi:MAG: hypothetical protein KGL35_06540, partial [Bradyrhizobium sp.]|nr:hypothetical protein [Bradyrhizobium sp.]
MADLLNIRMPDGTIIKNVPAGTPPAQIEAAWKSATAPKQSWGTTLSEIPARAFGSFADMFGNAP